MDINVGDVFKAYNNEMIPKGKIKYHLCINTNTYFMINSDPNKEG